MRAQIEKKMEQREKEKREENLKQLAARAREERAGIKRGDGELYSYRDSMLVLCTCRGRGTC